MAHHGVLGLGHTPICGTGKSTLLFRENAPFATSECLGWPQWIVFSFFNFPSCCGELSGRKFVTTTMNVARLSESTWLSWGELRRLNNSPCIIRTSFSVLKSLVNPLISSLGVPDIFMVRNDYVKYHNLSGKKNGRGRELIARWRGCIAMQCFPAVSSPMEPRIGVKFLQFRHRNFMMTYIIWLCEEMDQRHNIGKHESFSPLVMPTIWSYYTKSKLHGLRGW